MRRGRRAAGTSTGERGTCPVCRGTVRLRNSDGKVFSHGVNAANPRGCPGRGEAPLRVRRQQQSDPSPIRPPVTHDAAELPALDIEVLVERDGPGDPMVRMRSAPRPPEDAA